ncbi:soluble lytic murein transglycosylase [Comamonas odontotermitis]|uniref:Soluble lytic murein transglycosylase n=1 Tax=Comamonas odontotermitis TaxID=379895 RepID=A0ABR6RBU5_9BURK|nr:soluble lytic murein transglycosylase [Comamonas odontotermitis]
MRWKVLFTPLMAALLAAGALPLSAQTILQGATQVQPPPAQAALQTASQMASDDVIVDMQQAFRKRDKTKLSQLLPSTRGHVLEPWAAYWELRARLQEATQDEVQAFLTRWAGTYQEDRLRNDWLRLLGQRRDWGNFDALYPAFRMGDDRELRCYAAVIDLAKGKKTEQLGESVKANWYAQRDSEDGCNLAASEMYSAGKLQADDIWRRARLAMETGRTRAARAAVEIAAPVQLQTFSTMLQSPAKYLATKAKLQTKEQQELATLALIKMAADNPEGAANLMDSRWGELLSQDKRDWIWGVIGKTQATRLSPDALASFAKVGKDSHLNDDMLSWKARAALRAGQWQQVRKSIEAMSGEEQRDPTWVYWRAKALQAGKVSDTQATEARELLQTIAGPQGFYEQLAQEDLGQKISVNAAPVAIDEPARQAVRSNPGLARALYAIQLGLRSEGVREWNYTTNLHENGGMGDKELLAAAELACQRQIWDRCINTSERTKSVVDVGQRFPMPFKDAVVSRSRAIGLDPAYVYGLIRQESRFIMDARSGVGASGLMQIMPATARWTARKIGMTDFTPGSINDRDTNIALGTAYLKLALDDFDGSMAMAAAGYNAGPGRPRNWRNGPVLDGAIWAENVPFSETRDYVKKVLSNTTSYAAILTGQPQSLRARLGTVGPRAEGEPDPSKDLP